jgi:hypothetical protein
MEHRPIKTVALHDYLRYCTVRRTCALVLRNGGSVIILMSVSGPIISFTVGHSARIQAL